MPTTVIYIILAVLGVFLAYTVAAPVLANIRRFLGRVWLFCPEHREYALVRLNALGAALTAGYGAPKVAVRRCTLRKPHEVCDENCLKGADL